MIFSICFILFCFLILQPIAYCFTLEMMCLKTFFPSQDFLLFWNQTAEQQKCSLVHSSRLSGMFGFCAFTHCLKGEGRREKSKTKRCTLNSAAHLHLCWLLSPAEGIIILSLCAPSYCYEIYKKKTLLLQSIAIQLQDFYTLVELFILFKSQFLGSGHLGKECFLS